MYLSKNPIGNRYVCGVVDGVVPPGLTNTSAPGGIDSIVTGIVVRGAPLAALCADPRGSSVAQAPRRISTRVQHARITIRWVRANPESSRQGTGPRIASRRGKWNAFVDVYGFGAKACSNPDPDYYRVRCHCGSRPSRGEKTANGDESARLVFKGPALQGDRNRQQFTLNPLIDPDQDLTTVDELQKLVGSAFELTRSRSKS